MSKNKELTPGQEEMIHVIAFGVTSALLPTVVTGWVIAPGITAMGSDFASAVGAHEAKLGTASIIATGLGLLGAKILADSYKRGFVVDTRKDGTPIRVARLSEMSKGHKAAFWSAAVATALTIGPVLAEPGWTLDQAKQATGVVADHVKPLVSRAVNMIKR